MVHLVKVIWLQGLLDFALSAYFIFITWSLYEQTENVMYTGLFVGLGFLPSLLCIPFIGVFVDRYNKKYLLLLALILMLMTICIVLIYFENISPTLLIISNMVLQLCGSIVRPTMQAYLAAIFNKEHLIVIFQKSASFTIIGGILGTAISSFFIAQTLISTLSFVIVLALIIALYLLWQLPTEQTSTARTHQSIFKEMMAGFIYSLSSRFFLQLLAIMAIGQLIYHTTIGFLAAYTYDVLKSTSTIYGILEITVSISGVLAGLLGAKFIKKFQRFSPLVIMTILIASLLLLAFDTSIALIIVGCAGIGYCTTWIRTTFQAIQQISTETQYHGRAASIRMFFNQGTVVCLTPVFGILAKNFSIHYVFFILAGISFIGMLLCSTSQVHKQF
ncbi:MFS transporter [Bacillus ndiopicus]|uniref:MFS transporter n=1 Tax=Bacillus ndiopicus TaxID=1347368 RepID=UPI0005A83E3F|nr:MFS transporter [Bacillus ndiopicus]